jgi:Ca-activated chloride channel family protein
MPVRVIFLLDLSGSTRLRLETLREAVPKLVEDIVRPGIDDAALVAFNDQPGDLTPQFSDDPKVFAEILSRVRAIGGTSLYDAIMVASERKLYQQLPAGPRRKILLLITDGQDNSSRNTEAQALEVAQRSGAQIIALDLYEPQADQAKRGFQVLTRLGVATGGFALKPEDPAQLSRVGATVRHALDAELRVTLRPAKLVADGSGHKLVIVGRDKGVTIHHTAKYFAPKRPAGH